VSPLPADNRALSFREADQERAMSNEDLPSRPGKDPEFQDVVFQLTSAERAIALSGLIVILGTLLVSDIILDDYSVSHSTWLTPIATLAAIYFFYAGDRNPWHE
jgi:hypothetical protein